MSTTVAQPALPEETQQVAGRVALRRPWVMLFSRIALFFLIQAVIAGIFYLRGAAQPWEESANWWPLVVILTNILTIGILIWLYRKEGASYWSLFRVDRSYLKADLLVMLAVTILMMPVAYLPNVIMGEALFGTSEATLPLIVRPLPLWVVYFAILFFPLTQGFAELPTYFGYVMPRFKARGMAAWLAIGLPSLMLGLQHLAVPFLFDLRFIAWRAFMYLPFAIMVGAVLYWRGRLLPYLVIVHILIDMAFAMMLLDAAF